MHREKGGGGLLRCVGWMGGGREKKRSRRNTEKVGEKSVGSLSGRL